MMMIYILVLLLQSSMRQMPIAEYAIPTRAITPLKNTSSNNKIAITVYYCDFGLDTYQPVTPERLHVFRRKMVITNKTDTRKLFSLLQPGTYDMQSHLRSDKHHQSHLRSKRQDEGFSKLVTRLIVEQPHQPTLLVDQDGHVKQGKREYQIDPSGLDMFLTRLYAKR